MRRLVLVPVAAVVALVVIGAVGSAVLGVPTPVQITGGMAAWVDTAPTVHVVDTICSTGPGACQRSELWYTQWAERVESDGPDGSSRAVILIPPYRFERVGDGAWQRSTLSGTIHRTYMESAVRGGGSSDLTLSIVRRSAGALVMDVWRGTTEKDTYVVDGSTFAPIRIATARTEGGATRTETLDFDGWNAPLTISAPPTQ